MYVVNVYYTVSQSYCDAHIEAYAQPHVLRLGEM